MVTIVKINLKEVIFDYKNASDVLNKACSRGVLGMQVLGGFKFKDNLIFCLEERLKSQNAPGSYIIAPMDALSEDEMIGEINSRYTSNFLVNFCFEIDDKIWGVFFNKGSDLE